MGSTEDDPAPAATIGVATARETPDLPFETLIRHFPHGPAQLVPGGDFRAEPNVRLLDDAKETWR